MARWTLAGILVPMAFAIGCGGDAPPAKTTAALAPRCAIPVTFGNQSAWATSTLEPRATAAAHDALIADRACGRAFSLAFALGRAEDEPSAMRAELDVTVLSSTGAILATSSVTVRIPKPVSESEASAAIAKAAAVLARQAAAKVRP